MHDSISSGLCRHLGHLRHFGHLGYLSHLSHLNTLDPYPLDTALTDSYPKAFVTEMDPKDPGPFKGYLMDNLFDPLPIATPLLPHYTSQFPYTSWITCLTLFLQQLLYY
jgi:hypothetical protein